MAEDFTTRRRAIGDPTPRVVEPRPPAKPCAYCAGGRTIFQGSTLLHDESEDRWSVESDFGPIGLPVVCRRCSGTGRERA